MKRKMTLGLVMTAILTTLLWAGSLNPPAPPTTGTMKPLNDVEPRTAIHQSDIPLTISTSGSYYLAENVSTTGSQECITVNVDNVTIDLCGFTMTGADNSSGYGIYMNGRDNVEVRNGTIRDFATGIIGVTLDGKNHRILGVRILSCVSSGINLERSDNCQIRDCTIADSGTVTGSTGTAYGIRIGSNSIVSGNTVYNNGISTSYRVFCIQTGSCCKVTDNTIYSNGASSTADYAVGIWTGYGSTVSGNNVYDNGDSTDGALVYGIYVGTGCVVTGNAVFDNGDSAGDTVSGITCNDSSTVTNNAVYGNGTAAADYVYGLQITQGCIVIGNTAYDNGDSSASVVYGINAGLGSTINNNSAYSNGTSSTGGSVFGFYAGSGSTVTGNTARSNGTGASGNVYGIYLGGYNLVNNNTAYNNSGTGGGTNINVSATSVYGTNCAP